MCVLVRRDWCDALPPERLLAGEPLRAWGRPVQHDLVGRGPVEVLDTARGQVVAKRLRRGGLLAALLPDRFADPDRPAREAALAEALAGAGCPTPPVVAARATATGFGLHRLEIATARVQGGVDLLAALVAGQDRAALAAQAGRTLRGLHDAGLRHRDLQVKNLLVPPEGPAAERAFVLDLDRCRLGVPLDGDARTASLARFARSLVKHGLLSVGSAQQPAANPSRGALRAFLAGYGSLPGLGRSELCRQVALRLRRQVRWHRWFWGQAADGLVQQ